VGSTASQDNKDQYEFGPFRVDAEKELLLRDGAPVALTPKTFQVLLVLVRRRNEVVTKDDLMKTVWPDTFVEETNLTRTIFMLRKALGENLEDHKYIVTVPGRGYRLAERVRLVPNQELTIAAVNHSRIQVHVEERWPWRWISVGLVLLIAAGSVMLWLRRPTRPVLTDRDTVVLGDFANSTGQAVFDGTLRQGLAVELEQSPFLSLISDQQIAQTLRMMDQKSDARLTPEVARQICQRTGSAAYLEGSIARVGAQYLLTVRAVNCTNGQSLASSEASADENHVLAALGKVSSDIRKKLGESLSTVQKFDTPLQQATTPSLEALKAFSSGIQVINTRGPDAAIPFFEHAIELDPKFALAYAYLGIMENDIVEPSKAVEYERTAYELRQRTAEVEQYAITASYEKEVTGNIEKAIDACQLWIQAYPRAYHPHDLLAGPMFPIIGQYDRAVDEASQAIRLNPDFPIPYAQRMFSLIALNRLNEAKATYAQALERKLGNPFLDLALYQVAFLENDVAGMAKEVEKTKGLQGFEDQILNLEGDTAAYAGRLQDAREFSRRAIDSARAAGKNDTPLIYSVTSALREAWFGNKEEAKHRIAQAFRGAPPRDVLYLAALTLAYSGEMSRTQTISDDLAKKYPEDTLVQFNFLPTLRATIALEKGNASAAIEELKATAPYELGVSHQSPFTWTAMYPVFVRGEAYLAARHGPEAIAEFQKILDHRGIVLNQPIAALALLGLARAYVLQGDVAKARAEYDALLALWKRADSDLPVLKQANVEYLRLKSLGSH
jgi:DNA-binding winged helix-turn-helix (wHTH) protein/tetratricopeptide (TPR) repeat protein